ncbi:HpcH/HpaI aldolase family protein [Devosia beringensis]|uniref:HpcH/HpaI aldolase family protein n=1 Tax=Devosia beringensis TaxID=2657486 RepID=UPI00186B892D|nr:HpcH/HpaI aldolase/citrate lyase family protein [Devosia beringensis]
MELPTNPFKKSLAAGQRQLGFWQTFRDPLVTEVLCDAGFDWMVIDGEHSPNTITDVLAQLQVLGRSRTMPVVRLPWNDPVLFKMMLDLGALSMIVPYIQSADEARAAVASVRYPPAGIRGIGGATRAGRFGRIPDYLHRASEEICLLVQAETKDAIAVIEDIALVDGVDGVFIGPADLSASMGLIGQSGHADVQTLIAFAAKRLKAVGKPSGIIATNDDEIERYIDYGFQFIAVGVDAVILARAADTLAEKWTFAKK